MALYGILTPKDGITVETDVLLFVADHPQAKDQTTFGQNIWGLKVWNGKLYAGYGDYGDNTGPISLTPLNLQTDTFAASPVHVSSTEAIETFRIIDGNLYAPATDRRTSADYMVASVDGSGTETWSDKNPVNSTHMYDMAKIAGKLCMAGSKGSNATVFSSSDDGNTWQTSLSVPPVADFARFYGLAKYNNKLYTEARDYSGSGRHPESWMFDGTTWSSVPVIFDGAFTDAHEFNGKLVYRNTFPHTTGTLKSYDGSTVSTIAFSINDIKVVGTELFRLSSSGVVSASSDLSTWRTVFAGPTNAKSFEVYNGAIYFGTTDAKIYKVITGDG